MYIFGLVDWWIFAILVSSSFNSSRWSILGWSWNTQRCHTFLTAVPGRVLIWTVGRVSSGRVLCFRRRWIEGFWKKFIQIFWVLLCKPRSNRITKATQDVNLNHSESATWQIWNFKGGKSRKTAGSFGLDFLEKENEVGTLEPLFFWDSHITYDLSFTCAWHSNIWKDQENPGKPWCFWRRLPGSKRSKAELPQCWAISYLS